MRLALDKACAASPPLAPVDWRTLAAVLALLPSYSKLSDEAYVEQIAAIGAVSYRSARRSLKKLEQLGILVYESRRGGNRPPRITMPADVETGPPLASQEEDGEGDRPDAAAQTGPLLATYREGTREENDVVVDNDLEQLVDQFAFSPTQRFRALSADPALAIAWLRRAREPDVINPEAFADAGIASGSLPGPRLTEVRGSHGVSVQLEGEPAARAWKVYAWDDDQDAMVLVGTYDDRDEARRILEEHDAQGGATMEAVR
jgi:DNA-binding transcriptional ArsR family regulator